MPSPNNEASSEGVQSEPIQESGVTPSQDPWKKLYTSDEMDLETASELQISVAASAAWEQDRKAAALTGSAVVLGLVFLTHVCLIAFPLSLDNPGQILSAVSELINLSPLALLSALLLFFRACQQKPTQPYGLALHSQNLLPKGSTQQLFRVAGALYLLLIPIIVSMSMDLRTIGLRQLNSLRSSQTDIITKANLELASAAGNPERLSTTKQQLRDYMLRYDMNAPGLDLEKVNDPDQLTDIMRGLQDQIHEQYLNKRFIADNDLMRRSLRNGIGALLYGSFLLFIGFIWPKDFEQSP